jgi:hypothetical protein
MEAREHNYLAGLESVLLRSELFRGGGIETAADSVVEIGPWTRKDSANLK